MRKDKILLIGQRILFCIHWAENPLVSSPINSGDIARGNTVLPLLIEIDRAGEEIWRSEGCFLEHRIKGLWISGSGSIHCLGSYDNRSEF